jgi:hypothetical protein
MGERRKNPRLREIEDVMDQAEEEAVVRGEAGEFANWSPRRRQDIPGLQCVDVLAWAIYQYGLLAFTKKPLLADAKIAWDDFGKHNGGKWGYDVTITRANLKKWVEKEMASGVSLEKFAAWQEKKLLAKGKNAKSRV